MNFQLGLQSFEPHIQGLHNLVQLSLQVRFSTPARFFFCSSISAALGTPRPARIPEAPIGDLAHASYTGYARSKLVGERLIETAVNVTGASAIILRIGQVVGDTKEVVWNDSEAFPLIVKSALTMGILPELGIKCEWLPVDTLAEIVVEIAGLLPPSISLGNGLHNASVPVKKKNTIEKIIKNNDCDVLPLQNELVYNLRSPRTCDWASQFLPALSLAGLTFSLVSRTKWLEQLRTLSNAQHHGGMKLTSAANPEKNPAIKLVDFFETMFAEKKRRRE